MHNTTKRLGIWAVVVAAILMTPLLANWPWTGMDFVFGIVVLYGAALVFELFVRKATTTAYRFAVGLAVLGSLLLVWINGAVGIIGEDEGINLLYAAVLLTGFVGAAISRLRPIGLSRTTFTMAVVQMLVPTIAFFIVPELMRQEPGILKIFILNAFFAAMFVGSGLLFRRASMMRAG